MHTYIIYAHILSGTTVLLIGLMLSFMKKGTPLHVKLGWVYVVAMLFVCFSAFTSIVFFRFSLFLLVIGILTFYATYNGVRSIMKRKESTVPIYDYIVSFAVLISGFILIGYGAYVLLVSTNYFLAILSMVFGFFTGRSAYSDIRFFRRGDKSGPSWWLYQHISAMGGSYIAAVSAFAVQNGDLIQIPDAVAWLPWVLPTIIGTPIISKAIARRRKKAVSISS